MKQTYPQSIIIALFAITFVLSASGQTVKENPQPRSSEEEELSRASVKGSGLEEEIESLIKEKKTDWKLIGVSKQPYGYSMQLWESSTGKIRIFSQKFESSQKATETFNKNKGSLGTSLGIRAESQNDIGEEAFTRRRNPKDAEIDLSFRKGEYLVIISGQKQDVMMIAGYIQSVTDKHSTEKIVQ